MNNWNAYQLLSLILMKQFSVFFFCSKGIQKHKSLMLYNVFAFKICSPCVQSGDKQI